MARKKREKKQKARVEWERLPEAEKLVEEIVTKHHVLLQRARIICIAKPKAGTKGESRVAATARRPSQLLRALYKDATGQDLHYVIEIGKDLWDARQKEDRIILLDHELQHCTGLNERGEWGFRPDHDVEEFTVIAQRYGPRAGQVRTRVMQQLGLVEKT